MKSGSVLKFCERKILLRLEKKKALLSVTCQRGEDVEDGATRQRGARGKPSQFIRIMLVSVSVLATGEGGKKKVDERKGTHV